MHLTFKGIVKEIPFRQNEYGKHSMIHSISTQMIRGGIEERMAGNKHKIDEMAQIKLDGLIDEYKEVFRDEPGLVRGYKCRLRLRTNEPVFQRLYAVPMAHQRAVTDEIDRMLRMDIIKRSRSPYSIPVVPVFKNNGEV